jgi:UDP-4-amino-4,6-dideoxy-N-acetyl-beta-L-altrosamine transaminase
MSFLPYARQSIDDGDIAAVADTLRGDWLTTGPAVGAFEKAFVAAVSAKHAMACSSGTAALHLAALAAGLGEGDAAVVPSLTFLATANCNRYVGAEVIFADVNPATGLMGSDHLEAAIDRADGRHVKAVYPVHLNGQCADMNAIRAVAQAHNLVVIEDASHALGARYTPDQGVPSKIGACAHSHMAVFSLHAAKTIAMGEGGVVTTNNEEFHRRLGLFRNHGMTRQADEFQNAEFAFDSGGNANPWYYEMSEPGFNYRASDIHCALGLSQLGKLQAFLSRRRALCRLYDDLLAPLAPLVAPIARAPKCEPAWHLYVIHIDFASTPVTRAQLMRRLRDAGIGTQVHYLPVHLQPYYRKRQGDTELPGALAYYQRCLSLPFFPAMTNEDAERVVTELEVILDHG